MDSVILVIGKDKVRIEATVGRLRGTVVVNQMDKINKADYVVYTDDDVDTTVVKGKNVILRGTLTSGMYIRRDFTYWPYFGLNSEPYEDRVVMSETGYTNGFCKYVNGGINFLPTEDVILVKQYTNGILATRIELFNRIADKAKNVPGVISAICLDSRIGNYYNFPERKKFSFNLDSLGETDPIIKAVIESNNIRR